MGWGIYISVACRWAGEAMMSVTPWVGCFAPHQRIDAIYSLVCGYVNFTTTPHGQINT
jgi:hypothetical protein